jgi:hypothetical protein
MSWARLDDRFWSNRKVRAAWKQCRASVGLHVMAIAYCAMHETDGVIDEHFLESLIPNGKERTQALDALLGVGLWHAGTDGFWLINDYLEFNPSRHQLAERRQRDAERKAQARTRGVQADTTRESERSPNGVRVDAAGTPRGIRRES